MASGRNVDSNSLVSFLPEDNSSSKQDLS
uniref:Uncharacterized protein n=1 Tax=Arundo donax TaxID=35708 RepID=A0A0A8Y723_ARUDO